MRSITISFVDMYTKLGREKTPAYEKEGGRGAAIPGGKAAASGDGRRDGRTGGLFLPYGIRPGGFPLTPAVKGRIRLVRRGQGFLH